LSPNAARAGISSHGSPAGMLGAMPVDPNRESWKPGMSWEAAVDEIHYLRGLAQEMGGPERIERQHAGGRYTVRERIEKLADPGTFVEMGPLMGGASYDADGNLIDFVPGGWVGGTAELDGRPVAVGGDDFTISGGSPSGVRRPASIATSVSRLRRSRGSPPVRRILRTPWATKTLARRVISSKLSNEVCGRKA